MKYVLGIVFSTLLIVATSAGGQEPPAQQLPESGVESSVKGALHNVLVNPQQIVVNDRIYALPETVWVDGTKHPVNGITALLAEGETVMLEFSGERRNGYRVVTRIRTNP